MEEKRKSRHCPSYQKDTDSKTLKSTRMNRVPKRKQGKSVDPLRSTRIPHIEENQKLLITNLISQSQQMPYPLSQSNNYAPCYNANMESNTDRLAFSLSSSRSEKIEPILPEQSKQFFNKKTLILDLDETLVHSGFKPFNPSDLILSIELEKQLHNIHVLVRPGVEQFLSRMAKRFEIIVFTASLSKYADPLLDILDKEKVCQHRLFRENCTIVNGAFIKDLKRLGRNMKNVILVDNSPVAYALHPENGFPIKSWYEDKNDKELYNLAPLIEFLSYVPDVRQFIPKMVVNNEISFPLSMDLIKNYNNQLKNQQIQMQQCHNKVFSNRNNKHNENINDIEGNNKAINIKIVNNNYTNYIYNNNSSNNILNGLNQNKGSNNSTDDTKHNNKRNKNRNSCSGSNTNTNLQITSSSSSKQLKSNITQDSYNNVRSCRNTHSKKKDAKKKNMIKLSTAKENANNKANIPIPINKNNSKRINLTTHGSKSKSKTKASTSSTNITTNGCNEYINMDNQYHKRQRSFNKERSLSKSKYNMNTKCSTKHSRSNSSNQSKIIGLKPGTFNSVDRIAFPYDSNKKTESNKKSKHKSLKRTKSSDKLSAVPFKYSSYRYLNNNILKNYSTNVTTTLRPENCIMKNLMNIDMKRQYDSDMIPLPSQSLLYY